MRLRLFIASAGLANLADGIALLAWGWLASLLTREPLLIAAVPIALRLPWAVLAIPAGLATDRGDRRRMIVAMDCLRAAAFAIMAVALALHGPLPEAPGTGVSVPWLLALLTAVALVSGGAEVFRDNAAQTMMPALVPHDRLEQANGRLWSVELTTNLLAGPAVGAVLIGWAAGLPFAANALAYAAAAALVARLPGAFRPSPRPRAWRAELSEAAGFLVSRPLLVALAVATGAWNFLHAGTQVALLLHAQDNLGTSALAYSGLLAAAAAGGIAGGWIAPWIVGRIGRVRTIRAALVASPLGFAAMALAPGPVALALALAGFEFAGIAWNTVSVATRQRLIPDAMLGRVNALYRLLAWGSIPAGLAAAGWLIGRGETVVARGDALLWPFWMAAAGSAVLAAACWRVLGRIEG